jgi:hypothetical protein
MVEGTIRAIDHNERVAEIELRDGRMISLHLPRNAHIEVSEPASGGLQGGTLEDLGVGYLVQVDYHEDKSGKPCHCTNLISIS